MNSNLMINIGMAVIVIIVLIVLWKMGYKKQVKAILLSLVAGAEKEWGSQTGEIKFSDVYRQLPTIITIFYTKAELTKLIDDAAKYLKEYLESNDAAKKKIII